MMEIMRDRQKAESLWPEAKPQKDDGGMFDPFVPKKTCLDRSERQNGYSKPSEPAAEPRPEVELTDDQKRAAEALREFVRSDDREFLLSGYAGTGKTTVLQHWLRGERVEVVCPVCDNPQFVSPSGTTCKNGHGGLEPYFRKPLRVAFAAPTNKATRVLWEMAGAHGLSVECSTIHKLLKLKVMSDAEKRYAAKRVSMDGFADRPMSRFDVVVVDEASMVGNKPQGAEREHRGLYDMAVEEAAETGAKLIWVGDPAQLPPVQDSDSPAFQVPRRAELTRVVRQALDNPILALATWIRSAMYGEDSGETPALVMSDGTGAAKVQRDEWMERIFAAYDEDPFHPTKTKVLAARNKVVDDINQRVRAHLVGPDAAAEPYLAGERLVATEPVALWERGRIAGVAMATDEEAVIVSAERARHPKYFQYLSWELELEVGGGMHFKTYVVDPADRVRWQHDVEAIGKRESETGLRRYYLKWELNDAFGHLRHHYAMTVHRSQGSTYETVFVDAEDISSWPGPASEMARLMYTAVTRPRKGLWLCGA